MKLGSRLLRDQYYADLYRLWPEPFSQSGGCVRLGPAGNLVIFAEKGGQIREQAKAKQWLFTTLYRLHIALLSKNRHSVHTFEESGMDIRDETQDSDAARHLEQKEMIEALRELDDTHRTVLTLFYLNQHSYKEIAVECSTSRLGPLCRGSREPRNFCDSRSNKMCPKKE